MDKNALLDRLIAILCEERKEKPPALAPEEKADFFRALCNVRPPRPVTEEFLRLQDEYLSARKEERGVVEADSLPYRDGIALWRGSSRVFRAAACVHRQRHPFRRRRASAPGLPGDDAGKAGTQRARPRDARLQPARTVYLSYGGADRARKCDEKG